MLAVSSQIQNFLNIRNPIINEEVSFYVDRTHPVHAPCIFYLG